MSPARAANILTRPRVAPRCLVALLASLLVLAGFHAHAVAPASPNSAAALFQSGCDAYTAGDYLVAAAAFGQAAALQPASGTFLNLGLAEWQRGRPGYAILSWERARWLDPFSHAAQDNLRFGRKAAQLETPDLAWYEVVSTWLPANWWAWIAGASFWLAVAAGTLPGLLRRRRAGWQQSLAAFFLAIFLLSLPAHLGVATRSRLGFILEKDTPLRLTPTAEGQWITRLGAGEPARIERAHGRYLLIRTSRTKGWVEQSQIGRLASRPSA